MSIAKDTPLLPLIVADTVIDELSAYLGVPISRDYAERLEKHAEGHYAASPSFRRRLKARGDSGRDYLYSFMRHWLSAFLKESEPELYQRLPEGFSMGRPAPRPAIS